MSILHERYGNKPEFDPAHNESDRAMLRNASEELEDLLRTSGIDTDKVALWGYDRDGSIPNPVNDEFSTGEGTRLTHVGRIEDTRPSDAEDDESREDAWIANPIKYALEAGDGRIRLVDLDKIRKLPHEQDEEFGTIAVNATPDQFSQATLGFPDIHVVKDIATFELSDSQFDAISKPPSIEEAVEYAKTLGITPDSGIVKLRITSDGGKELVKYITTESNDFGTCVRKVINVSEKSIDHSDEPSEADDLGQVAVEAAIDSYSLDNEKADDLIDRSTISVPESKQSDIEELLDRRKRNKELPGVGRAVDLIGSIVGDESEVSSFAGALLEAGSEPAKIQEYLAQENNERAHEVRERIRAGLRVRLNMILDTMPDRVRSNQMKRPNGVTASSYPQELPSQDYVVEMALQILSGKFNDTDQQLDGHSINGMGENRVAAFMLLDTFKIPEKNEDTFETSQYMIDVKRDLRSSVDSIYQSINGYGGVNVYLEELLRTARQSMIDTDNLSQNIHAVLSSMSRVEMGLGEMIAHVDRMATDLPSDKHAEQDFLVHLRGEIGSMMSVYNELRYNDHFVSTMQMVSYQPDEMYVMQFRGMALRGDMEHLIDQFKLIEHRLYDIVE